MILHHHSAFSTTYVSFIKSDDVSVTRAGIKKKVKAESENVSEEKIESEEEYYPAERATRKRAVYGAADGDGDGGDGAATGHTAITPKITINLGNKGVDAPKLAKDIGKKALTISFR